MKRPPITLQPVLFMVMLIVPQLTSAVIMRTGQQPHPHAGIVNATAMWCFLFTPCRDPHFGQGRPWHWVRQTIFILCAIATTTIALWPSN